MGRILPKQLLCCRMCLILDDCFAVWIVSVLLIVKYSSGDPELDCIGPIIVI